MPRLAIPLVLLCATMAFPSGVGARPLGAGGCLVNFPGKVEHCFSPGQVSVGESRFPGPLAPPQGVVRRYTRLRLSQVMLIERNRHAQPQGIYFLFGRKPTRPSSGMATKYVMVGEFTSGMVVSKASGWGTWNFSAILPPSDVLLDVRSNLPCHMVRRIGSRLVRRSTRLMTVALIGIDSSFAMNGFSIWRAWGGRPAISARLAAELAISAANESAGHHPVRIRQIFLARITNPSLHVNLLCWVVSMVSPGSGFRWTLVFIDAQTGSTVLSSAGTG